MVAIVAKTDSRVLGSWPQCTCSVLHSSRLYEHACKSAIIQKYSARRVTKNPDPRPAAGKDIPITAFVLPNTAPVGSVRLTYLVNYGTPTSIPMTAAPGMPSHLPPSALLHGIIVAD